MNNKDEGYLAHFLFPELSGDKKIRDVLKRAAPERICRVKFSEGDYAQDICLQVYKDKLQITSIKEADTFSYKLKEPDEVRRACYYLLNCFDLTDEALTDAPALLMPKRKYEELRDKASSYTLFFLSQCLTAETGDQEYSAKLAKVLKSHTADGELRLCSRHEGVWKLQQASFMEDASGGWLVRVSPEASEDWIIAVPLTRAQLCSIFYNWVLLT